MSDSSVSVARAAWLIVPVTMAGLVHVAVLKTNVLHRLAVPLDGGKHWHARPLFGPHKTWRGVLLMTACTAGFTHVQSIVERRKCPPSLRVCSNFVTSPWLAGSAMGLAYCLAELPNSFVKRRLGIRPGARSTRAMHLQYILDQTDSVFGCLIALHGIYRPRRAEAGWAFVLGSVVHIAIDQFLYVIRVKQHPG